MNAGLDCWTRTIDHVQLARGACQPSCCPAGSLSEQLEQAKSGSNLLICPSNKAGKDEEMGGSGSGGVDCLPFHLKTWLDTSSTVFLII